MRLYRVQGCKGLEGLGGIGFVQLLSFVHCKAQESRRARFTGL